MTQSDNIAELIYLACALWALLRLTACDDLFSLPWFSLFALVEVAHPLIWMMNLWAVWDWGLPTVSVTLAAAAAESAWNMSSGLGQRQKVWSRIFSFAAGVALAIFVLYMKPLFPGFPPLSLRIAMALTGFAAGCACSAVMYWWANRSEGVRDFVSEGAMLTAYAVVIVVSAVVSRQSDDLWDASVQLSCIIRAGLLVAATLSLTRHGLTSAHA
jgi:hypothetical protein